MLAIIMRKSNPDSPVQRRLSLASGPHSGATSQVFFGLWAKHSTFLYEFTSQVTQRLGGNPADLEERIVVSVSMCH